MRTVAADASLPINFSAGSQLQLATAPRLSAPKIGREHTPTAVANIRFLMSQIKRNKAGRKLWKCLEARRGGRYREMSFASRKAVAAARPPTMVVCKPLRHGGVPVARPFKHPNTPRASIVTTTETTKARCAWPINR